MSERFYVSAVPVDSTVMLDGPEAHHLLHVMRATVGDEVTLFDGLGCEYRATIARCGKRELELSIATREAVDRELPFELVLAVALPRGDRQAWLIEKAVELGVTRLVPLRTARGVAQPVDSALERLRRGVIEASKQCGRNRLMEIAPACELRHLHELAPAGARRWLAHPGGVELSTLNNSARSQHVWFAIGPEGGFSDEEVSAAIASSWQAVSLGRRIMRVETAALALAAWTALRST